MRLGNWAYWQKYKQQCHYSWHGGTYEELPCTLGNLKQECSCISVSLYYRIQMKVHYIIISGGSAKSSETELEQVMSKLAQWKSAKDMVMEFPWHYTVKGNTTSKYVYLFRNQTFQISCAEEYVNNRHTNFWALSSWVFHMY